MENTGNGIVKMFRVCKMAGFVFGFSCAVSLSAQQHPDIHFPGLGNIDTNSHARSGGAKAAGNKLLMHSQGVVRRLDLATNVVIISGTKYTVATDAKVEIRGTFGAFSMLKVGMKVSFEYQPINDKHREIVSLKQLSDNSALVDS
ncbi:MAG: hypothetical protein KUG75_16275 [Pseudomonadales bacterium]|nr:hypothetical protein [Pseudomonadales bacterium]